MAHEVRRHDVVQKIELTAIHSLAKAASQRLVLLSSRAHSQPPSPHPPYVGRTPAFTSGRP